MPLRGGLPLSPDLLEVEDLTKHFPVKISTVQRLLTRSRPYVHAVDGVSFALREGEIFGVVGESGCGKTTLGRTVLRLAEPTSGTLRFMGADITHLREKALRPLRRLMQIVFQDPHASLNPAMSIGESIADSLLVHGGVTEAAAKKATLEMMTEVGLSPAEKLYGKYPADLSGGQKQRAVIARALIVRPKLIVADEPVAMLDMSIRARILELMLQIKEKYGLTYLFITHDLATAKFICDRIAIMYLGKVVEVGDSAEIYRDPKHPYTQALLGAIPIPDPERRRAKTLPKGEVPDAIHPPHGCRFHPRCPVATSSCGWEPRDILDLLDERALDEATHRRDTVALGTPEDMKIEGQILRIPAGPKGLPRDAVRKSVLSLLLLGLVYAAVNPSVAIGFLCAGFLSLIVLDRLSRREDRRLRGRPDVEGVRRNVEAILRTAPRPMAEAVRRVEAAGGDVLVEFAPAEDPGLRHVDGREVRCVLY